MKRLHPARICAALLTLAGALPAATPRWQLPEARNVQLGGDLGDAYRRGRERLSEDPYRSAAYLRSDFSFETNRVFVNYSGDISGRFIELASLMSPPGRMEPALLAEVLHEIGTFQKADGHFGREVNWNESLEPENPNATLLPIFWGNSRLLVGLLEAHRAFGQPEFLQAAKRLGDFYLATAGRFLDPAREAEYRMTGSYAAGYVTDYFPGIEGLARLYQVTREARYLQQAERMAEFFKRFDTLPIDHSHGNLITHYGLLLLHEITGKAEYLDRPLAQWRRAVEGGFVWPMGGVGEKFRVSYSSDEGCSEADWLRLNLTLWRLTGDTRFLELADRLLWNHYAMNRAPNGGYGHHSFVCDPDGPLRMNPQFTEAVWCCSFHGLLGLHTFKRHVVVGADAGAFVNFFVPAEASVPTGAGETRVAVSAHQEPDRMLSSMRWETRGPATRTAGLRFRPPAWAERVRITNARGEQLAAPAENGYLVMSDAASTEFHVSCEFGVRVEDRRLQRVRLDAKRLVRHPGVTLWDGPHLLLAGTEQIRPALAVAVADNGQLQLPRAADGTRRCVVVPGTAASEAQITAAAQSGERLRLASWEHHRRDLPAAFVFDLIAVPENSELGRLLKQ
jgi:hypothetical protein